MDLTENQKKYMDSLKAGPGLIPSIVAGALVTKGMVEKTGEGGAQGKSHVRLTAAGQAAL